MKGCGEGAHETGSVTSQGACQIIKNLIKGKSPERGDRGGQELSRVSWPIPRDDLPNNILLCFGISDSSPASYDGSRDCWSRVGKTLRVGCLRDLCDTKMAC